MKIVQEGPCYSYYSLLCSFDYKVILITWVYSQPNMVM